MALSKHILSFLIIALSFFSEAAKETPEASKKIITVEATIAPDPQARDPLILSTSIIDTIYPEEIVRRALDSTTCSICSESLLQFEQHELIKSHSCTFCEDCMFQFTR